ncbi:MAG: bleomycin resistance protein [Rhodospirillales bacterium]|nr:bleomycin resistance protein [Rhodospirillales bacterium]
MRGLVDHVDLTVRNPESSRAFYEAVLGFMGYTHFRSHDDGLDFDMPGKGGWRSSIGIRKASGEGAGRSHDRYSPGLHHLAFDAQSRTDVDRLHQVLIDLGASILDAPADYPQYGASYYAVFFADPDGLKLEFVFRG